MKQLSSITLTAALIFIYAGCAAPAETAPTSDQVRADIEAANERFESFVASQDAAGLASLYTADGQFLVPGIEPATGHEEVRAAFEGMFEMGPVVIDLETIEVEAAGETAYEVGGYTMESEAGDHLDHGKYVVIWKQEDGEWKLHRDIFNSSMPPQQ